MAAGSTHAGWPRLQCRRHAGAPSHPVVLSPLPADTLILVRVVWFAQQDSSNQGFKIAWCTVMVVCQMAYIVSWRALAPPAVAPLVPEPAQQ